MPLFHDDPGATGATGATGAGASASAGARCATHLSGLSKLLQLFSEKGEESAADSDRFEHVDDQIDKSINRCHLEPCDHVNS